MSLASRQDGAGQIDHLVELWPTLRGEDGDKHKGTTDGGVNCRPRHRHAWLRLNLCSLDSTRGCRNPLQAQTLLIKISCPGSSRPLPGRPALWLLSAERSLWDSYTEASLVVAASSVRVGP